MCRQTVLWVVLAMVSRWVIGTEMVGVWHEPSLSRKTDAPRWAEALQKHGLTVRLLSSDDLANPQVLSPDRIAVVLLPYGPHFPADAVDNFCRYLKAGGRFVSLGGYAFDELFAKGMGRRGSKSGSGWRMRRCNWTLRPIASASPCLPMRPLIGIAPELW